MAFGGAGRGGVGWRRCVRFCGAVSGGDGRNPGRYTAGHDDGAVDLPAVSTLTLNELEGCGEPAGLTRILAASEIWNYR